VKNALAYYTVEVKSYRGGSPSESKQSRVGKHRKTEETRKKKEKEKLTKRRKEKDRKR
jgi:hypothetical protein